MTSFTITKRLVTIFSRAITLHWDKVKARFDKAVQEKNDDEFSLEEEEFLYHFNDVRLKYDFYADREDDGEGDIIWDSATIYFYVRHTGCPVSIKSIRGTEREGILSQLSELEDKVYTICDCKSSLTEKDGYCEWCYPLVTTMEDNCPICMDNCEGVWYKTKCGHIFHKKCWELHYEKTNKNCNVKCPLCRADNLQCDGKEI